MNLCDRSLTRTLVIGTVRGAGRRVQPVGTRRKAAMGGMGSGVTLYEPAVCAIRVRGALSSDWSDRLGGLRISVVSGRRHTITELVGRVADQAALHGVLGALYELGLPLLSVECSAAPLRESERAVPGVS